MKNIKGNEKGSNLKEMFSQDRGLQDSYYMALFEEFIKAEHLEFRPQQQHLSKSVNNTINDNGVGIYNAGTGLGKTNAYILPILNQIFGTKSVSKAIISTGTKLLQSQIFDKDIPAAVQGFIKIIKAKTGESIEINIDKDIVVTKGAGNYFCDSNKLLDPNLDKTINELMAKKAKLEQLASEESSDVKRKTMTSLELIQISKTLADLLAVQESRIEIEKKSPVHKDIIQAARKVSKDSHDINLVIEKNHLPPMFQQLSEEDWGKFSCNKKGSQCTCAGKKNTICTATRHQQALESAKIIISNHAHVVSSFGAAMGTNSKGKNYSSPLALAVNTRGNEAGVKAPKTVFVFDESHLLLDFIQKASTTHVNISAFLNGIDSLCTTVEQLNILVSEQASENMKTRMNKMLKTGKAISEILDSLIIKVGQKAILSEMQKNSSLDAHSLSIDGLDAIRDSVIKDMLDNYTAKLTQPAVVVGSDAQAITSQLKVPYTHKRILTSKNPKAAISKAFYPMKIEMQMLIDILKAYVESVRFDMPSFMSEAKATAGDKGFAIGDLEAESQKILTGLSRKAPPTKYVALSRINQAAAKSKYTNTFYDAIDALINYQPNQQNQKGSTEAMENQKAINIAIISYLKSLRDNCLTNFYNLSTNKRNGETHVDVSPLFDKLNNYVLFNELLASERSSVMCLSATIGICSSSMSDTVPPKKVMKCDFSNFESSILSHQLKILLGRQGRPITRVYCPPAFDYANNAKLIIPTDMPAPDTSNKQEMDDYLDYIADNILRTSPHVSGNVAVLCTSNYQTDNIFNALSKKIAEQGIAGYELLHQHKGFGMQRTLEMMRERNHAKKRILIGSSLWTGIDLKGEALSTIHILKAPFAQPNDPLTVEKTAIWKAMAGQSYFQNEELPKTCEKLHQGIGRLIRDSNDKGIWFFYDPIVARVRDILMFGDSSMISSSRDIKQQYRVALAKRLIESFPNNDIHWCNKKEMSDTTKEFFMRHRKNNDLSGTVSLDNDGLTDLPSFEEFVDLPETEEAAHAENAVSEKEKEMTVGKGFTGIEDLSGTGI